MLLQKLKPWTDITKEALRGSFAVARFLCFVHVTSTYLCTIVKPYGPSMVPTLNVKGDLVLVDRVTTRFRRVSRGDVVLVRSPEDANKLLIKRVVGVEGDAVTYLLDPPDSDREETVVVPKGKVWVEGDNVYNTRDSRHFSAVPCGLVEGRLFWRIWPPTCFGSLNQSAK